VRRRFPLHAAAFRQARAPVTWLKCSRMHVRYFDDNVVFFGSSRFVHLGPGCGSGFFYFAHPISWPKRNVKTMSLPGLSSTLMPRCCAFVISVTMARANSLPEAEFVRVCEIMVT
jgi:hypothetical protein